KVKTDRVDAVELARLLFVHEFQPTAMPKESLLNLKVLTRTRGQIVKQRSHFLNQLQGAIEQIAPLFPNVLNPGSLTALNLLTQLPTPGQWLEKENQSTILTLVKTLSRHGQSYAQKTYANLLACAEDAQVTGLSLGSYGITVQQYATIILALDEQIKVLDKHIQIVSDTLPDIHLLLSIPGIGRTLAAIILGEIGDIGRFSRAKQLVAFSGIDPAVKQSGKFVGTRNKVTKRGSPFLRYALYLAATTSIRKAVKKAQVNPVLYEYYQKKLESKTKKQALGAIMNKLLRIIYSVLKNQRPFQLISPQQQVQMYKERLSKAA
ncbi:IS110 family transposase, partial [Acetonema longum]